MRDFAQPAQHHGTEAPDMFPTFFSTAFRLYDHLQVAMRMTVVFQ